MCWNLPNSTGYPVKGSLAPSLTLVNGAAHAAEARDTIARMTLPVDGYQLKDISPRAFEHPADRAATAALSSIPGLDQVVRKLIELGYERALRTYYLGSSVRLGPATAARDLELAQPGLQDARPR